MTSISSLASSWASSLFSRLDTNNQGYLQKSDLESAFSKVAGKNGSGSADAGEIFSQLDGDSDGKVTQDELASTLQGLADQLDSQFHSMRMGHGGGMPPPPQGGPEGANGTGNMPPPPPENDTGFTKDELTSQLEEIGSSDSKRANFISNIVNNFEAADADGDGKVSFKEARAFSAANQSDSADASSGSSTSSTDTTAAQSSDERKLLAQIMQLMQAYDVFGQRGSEQGRQLSVSA